MRARGTLLALLGAALLAWVVFSTRTAPPPIGVLARTVASAPVVRDIGDLDRASRARCATGGIRAGRAGRSEPQSVRVRRGPARPQPAPRPPKPAEAAAALAALAPLVLPPRRRCRSSDWSIGKWTAASCGSPSCRSADACTTSKPAAAGCGLRSGRRRSQRRRPAGAGHQHTAATRAAVKRPRRSRRGQFTPHAQTRISRASRIAGIAVSASSTC
jgi:hypothetical protein